MRKKSSLFIIFLILFVSCPDPPHPDPSDPAIDPAPYEETEFIYSSSGTGSITYSLNGSDYTASLSEINMYSENKDIYSTEPQLCVDVYFDGFMAALELRLSYDSSGEPEYWTSRNLAGDERFWICLFETSDHYFYQRNSSSSWDFTCTIRPEEEIKYYIDSIDFTFSGSAVITGSYPVTITGIDIHLDLQQIDYLLINCTSTLNIDELRNYDTGSILSGITTDVFADPEVNLPLLVDELTSGYSDPLMKVRIIHDWICSNIYYDNEALAGQAIADEQPLDVLSSKRAVCEGLSLLMQCMCRLSGVDVRIIYGRVQGQGTGTGHAWNAVKVDGEYFLTDLTFNNRNFYDSDPGTLPADSWITGGFRSNYFLLTPERFIQSHYPWEDPHQFLTPPVSALEFDLLSMHSTLVSAVYNHYHRLNISIDQAIIPVYTINSAAREWTFTLPSGYSLEYFIRSVEDLDADIADNLSGITFLQKSGNDYRLTALPALNGDYWLYLKADNTAGDNPYIAIFYLEKTGNEPVTQTLPQQVFPEYSDFEVELISPLSGTLMEGETYAWLINTAGLSRMILYEYESTNPVVLHGSLDFSETSPGVWELSYIVPPGLEQLNVNILPEGESGSTTVLKYLIQ